MAQERNKRLVFNILTFLQASIQDGTVRVDDAEGVEVASQCLSEAFGVDLEKAEDQAAYALVAPDTLASVLEAHVASSAAAVPVVEEAPAPPATADQKAMAEKAKSLGNQKMAIKEFDAAIAAYGNAIELDGNNPVYWSNRAAAHSQNFDHPSAIIDARQAIAIDPSFSKGYSRLGHALFSSGEYDEAVRAYELGMAVDPTNTTIKSSLATARSRARASASAANLSSDEEDSTSRVVPSRSAPAGASGAAASAFPGLGGMGGMDLAGLMSNPAIMQMAQQMMAGGGMEQMMSQMMSGGGMPDMSTLMSDPTLRSLAESMGRGGAPPAPGGDGTDGPEDMYS